MVGGFVNPFSIKKKIWSCCSIVSKSLGGSMKRELGEGVTSLIGELYGWHLVVIEEGNSWCSQKVRKGL